MKKAIMVLTTLLVLGSFSMVSAFDFEGAMGVGAFFDYGIGMGDNFDEYDFGSYTGQVKMGVSFGGQFLYGLTSCIAIAALIDYQLVNFEYDGDSAPEDPDSENYIVFNVNGMYFFGTEAMMIPFVEAGLGFYMPSVEGADSKFGINFGVGMLYFISELMALEFGGRYHMIFDSEDIGDESTSKTTYLDFRLGIKYFFGGME